MVRALIRRRMQSSRDERGAALLIGVFSLVIVVAFAAIVVDNNFGRRLGRQAGLSADATALAAAGTVSDGGSWSDAVTNVKSYAHFNMGIDADAWVGCNDPDSRVTLGTQSPYYPDLGNANTCISVDSETHPTKVRIKPPTKVARTFFASYFGVDTVAGEGSAIATVASKGPMSAPCAVCVLSDNGTALSVGSSKASLNVVDNTGDNAGIWVNSSSSNAMDLQTNASMSARSINVVGGYTPATGNFSPKPNTGVSKVSDPLAYLTPPTGVTSPTVAPSCTGKQSSVTTVNGNLFVAAKGGICTISPGVYNGVSVQANAVLNLRPGTYVFLDGNIDLNGANAALNADQATIYLACASYPKPCTSGQAGAEMRSTGSNTSFNLSPPSIGTYQGLSIYSDPNNTSKVALTSAGSSMGSGTIYAKSGEVSLHSSGSNLTVQSMIVANKVSTVASGTSITVNYIKGQNVTLPPSRARVALYR